MIEAARVLRGAVLHHSLRFIAVCANIPERDVHQAPERLRQRAVELRCSLPRSRDARGPLFADRNGQRRTKGNERRPCRAACEKEI